MEMAARAPAVPVRRGRYAFPGIAVCREHASASAAKLVHHRHVARIDGLPLLLGPVDVSAFVIKIPEALDRTIGFTAAEVKKFVDVDFEYVAKNSPAWRQRWEEQVK